MPSILQPTVFKSGLNMVLVGLVIVGGSIAAWCYWGHHFWTALKGPTEVTLADIAKLEDPRQLPSTWIKVKFDKAVKSDVVLEETRNGVSRVDEEYLIFQAGDRWMIASVAPDFKGNEISGQIWRNNAGLCRKAVAAITEELKDVHHGKLFPFEFEAADDYGTNWKMFAGIMAFFVFAGGLFSCLGLGGVFKSFRGPNPADYGLDPVDYADVNPQTAAEADELVARLLHDSGH
jgi:hypothetical protein